MVDDDLITHITALVEEEHAIRSSSEVDGKRLARIEQTLDQCWDLLRQRRARDEFHQPDTSEPRTVDTVEGYQQ